MSQTKIKVSVVMPVFCGEKHLSVSVESVLGQTLQEIELICVDDGSTDNSLAILNDYAQRDKRVVIFSQENKGSGIARNLALNNARGEFVAFMDCDDFYPSVNTLKELYDKAVTNNVSICGGSFSRYINRKITSEFPEHLKPYVFDKEGLIQYRDYQFDYGYHRFIYRKNMLIENEIYFPGLRRFQDVPFMIKAMICAKEFYAIRETTYCYRKEQGRSEPKDWTSDKFRDVLIGITQNLKMSKEADLGLLHFRTWKHFGESAFYAAYEQALFRRNYETLSLIGPMLDELDPVLLERAVPFEGKKAIKKTAEIRDAIKACFENHEQNMNNLQKMKTEGYIAVSVIMPSLNVEPYIRLCIESAMNQSLTNIEIICVDAGSTDGTIEVLEQYAQIDERIRIIHSDIKSYGYQVNLGITEARGKYVAILETDDYIMPDMYESLFKIAEEDRLDVVKADFYQFFGDGAKEKRVYHCIVKNELSYSRVLNNRELLDLEEKNLANSMYIWAGLYNTDFLRKNSISCQETKGASFQDNGFWFEILMHLERIKFIKKPYYCLRRDNPNSSVMAKNKQNCMKEEYDYIRQKIETHAEMSMKDRFIHLCSYYRFKNYIFTYNRITEVMRLGFLKMMQIEFLELENAGELDYNLFLQNEFKQLVKIMTDPDVYYEESSAWCRETVRKMNKENNLSDTASRIEYSKLASLLIGLLDKLKKTVICVEEKGIRETIRKIKAYLKKRVIIFRDK